MSGRAHGRRAAAVVAGVVIAAAAAVTAPATAQRVTIHPGWSVLQHDRQHTGRIGVLGPRHPRQRCVAKFTGATIGSPVAAPSGRIYVVTGSDANAADRWRLHALRPNCTQIWSYRLPGWPGVTAPAVGPTGTIYVHTNGRYNIAGPPHLVAINPDGTRRWDLQYTGGPAALATDTPSSPVIAADGTIWIGAMDTGLYGVRPGGRIACVVPSPSTSSIDSSPAIAADGTVYALDAMNTLMAVNPGTCTLAWSISVRGVSEAGLGSSIAIGADETVYVPANEDLVAVRNDHILWRVRFGVWGLSTPAIGANGTIYVGARGLVAVGPHGNVLWRNRACLSYAGEPAADIAPVIGGRGIIYFQQRESTQKACAFRPDGTRIWTLTRAWGDAAGRLAITGSGLLLDTEGGFVGPVRLGIIAEAG